MLVVHGSVTVIEMVGNQGQEPMISGETRYNRTATRFTVNPNWSYRGDNTKYKEKK